MSEVSKSKDTLSSVRIASLIAPDAPSMPFGAGDTLSEYVYGPTRQDGSADRVVAFIDAVEPFIHQGEDVNIVGEYNEMKIERMLALVGDMPKEISDSERLRAIKHVLELDWIINHAGISDVRDFFNDQLDKNPDLAEQLQSMIRDLINKNVKVLSEDSRTKELAVLLSNNLTIEKAMDIAGEIRDIAPDLLQCYHTLIELLFIAKYQLEKDQT